MSAVVDLLDEDKPIAEQKYVCLSFISPENIIKQKELFFFENFTKQYHFNKTAELLTQYSNYLSFKYGINSDEMMEELKEFSKNETSKMHESVEDDYKNFMDKQEDKLNEKFDKEHAFQTSVRGLKVRGVFNTQEEAEMKSKKLRENDPNHDIFVGPVGIWVPWDPDAYKTGRVEHMEEELNALHKEKIKNEEAAKKEFEERVRESKKKAIAENIEKAKENNNKLTQRIDEEGNLIGVKETVDFDSREAVDVESAKLHNELLIRNAQKSAANEKDDGDSLDKVD